MALTLSRRIRELRTKKGLTQSKFGDIVGADQATVSRWESGQQEPEFENLKALAAFAGVPLDEFIDSFVSSGSWPEIPVVGAVEAGAWQEAIERPRDEWGFIAVPPTDRYPGVQRFALEVRGSSMNLLYPEGTVLVCVPAMEIGHILQPGQRVIVFRRDGAGLIEATVKEFQRGANGSAWLWPRSSDPAFQQPIPIPEADPFNEAHEVWVHAIVDASYRLEP